MPVKLLVIMAVFCTLSCGTVDYAKKYPKMVANVDPVSAGTISVQFGKFFSSSLKKVEVEVFFYPRYNAAVLEFRYELIRYRQFWDLESREQFTKALELYKVDYAARNLVDKYRKTRGIYGKSKIRVEWEAFKFAKTRVANPTVEIGYRFREKLPFFAILMRSAAEEPTDGDNSPRGESSQISIFFTRAQADELVKLFNQDYLMGLIGIRPNVQFSEEDEEIDLDPYREYDQ